MAKVNHHFTVYNPVDPQPHTSTDFLHFISKTPQIQTVSSQGPSLVSPHLPKLKTLGTPRSSVVGPFFFSLHSPGSCLKCYLYKILTNIFQLNSSELHTHISDWPLVMSVRTLVLGHPVGVLRHPNTAREEWVGRRASSLPQPPQGCTGTIDGTFLRIGALRTQNHHPSFIDLLSLLYFSS